MRVSSYTIINRKQIFFCFRFVVMFILFSSIVIAASSQSYKSGKRSISDDEIYNLPSSSLNLTLLLGFTQKAESHTTAGNYKINTSVQPYLEGGIDYQSMPLNQFSFVTGVHITATGRNAVFHVPVEKINSVYKEPYPPTKFTDFDIGLSFPLVLQSLWRLPDLKAIYGQVGIQVHYSLESDISYGDNYMDSTGSYMDVFNLNLNTNDNNKVWLTYSLGGGYQWILKNKNIFKVGIIANSSFTHFVTGDYTITIPGDPVTNGTYRLTGTYFGVNASYCFTKFKRIDARRRSEYESH